MTKFDRYKDKYKYIKLRREDGVVEMRLHSNGGELRWSLYPDVEVADALWEVGQDEENRCVIITGTGNSFCASIDREDVAKSVQGAGGPIQLLSGIVTKGDGLKLQLNHLAVPVPIIAAVNGPASVHGEVALLCDIVICTEDTYFQDSPHFPQTLVPGDGVHVVYPAVLGPNLGRYFLLTGMKLGSKEAWQRGLVAEIHGREELLDRAWALARAITERPPQIVRATRTLLVQKLRAEMSTYLPHGMTLEGFAAVLGYAMGTQPAWNPVPRDLSAGARRVPDQVGN